MALLDYIALYQGPLKTYPQEAEFRTVYPIAA